ncbi:PP2C family protein-serine/threonine phosphatase [Streptomyces zhaozhouensis]|uniref:PP2C family protein-serine/threonine phosphatase n=1 Tax=Streptomyces zhaozhouensis TaxID=1300267 RepID=UPI001141F026|nr:SpoIIE family protein phosphatase [Streptomyces zhaozhouensis]
MTACSEAVVAMARSEEGQGTLALLLERMHEVEPERLPALFNAHVGALGLRAVDILLADVRQQALISLPHEPGRPPERLPVDTSEAGRAYRTGAMETGEHPDGGLTLWLPLIDGVERIGVLGIRTDVLDRPTLRVCRALASLIALAVVSKSHFSDAFPRVRRSERMNMPAEMVWAYLPPRTMGTDQVTSSAVLEPAYDLGGDSFDHSLLDGDLHVSVLDAMGHDLSSGLASTVGMASCRNIRRDDDATDLSRIARSIDSHLAHWLPDRHLTGILCHLRVADGLLRWVNCGHPPPLLLRGQRVLAEAMTSEPQVPMGMGHRLGQAEWRTDSIQLEPGDRVLLHTDGVTDAKNATGVRFGEERFTEFVLRAVAAGEPAPEALRRLIRAILVHQRDRLSDDATILMFEWHPT